MERPPPEPSYPAQDAVPMRGGAESADPPSSTPDAESCDWCGSTNLWWRNCKLLCRSCNAIVKSCADL
jgi:ribosomal protein L40E